jgi:hypothetical protein
MANWRNIMTAKLTHGPQAIGGTVTAVPVSAIMR